MDFRFYLLLFLRRFPYFLVVATLGTAIGFTVAAILPPSYRAQAQLLVENDQIPQTLAASTVQVGPAEQMQIIQQRIMTRANLLELANRLQIYPQGAVPPPDEIVRDLRDRISIVTTGGNNQPGRPPTQATLVNVAFTAPAGPLAAAVTNAVVTMILQEDVAMRTLVSRDTLDFFNQEVDRLDKEVAQASERVLRFKEANKEALPDSLEYHRTQQTTQQERLLTLERDIAALKDRRQRLVELYQSTGQLLSTGTPSTPEQRQLQALKDQLTQAQAVYAAQNPRVVLLQQQVAALEKIVAGQISTQGQGQLSPYEVQLADLDSQIAAAEAEKTRIEAALVELARIIDATPGNAITLDTLQRDYDNVRAQYDGAVARKAQAATGDLIEALSKGQKITVIEQAAIPAQPTSPNRLLIALGGIGGGLAAGLGLVVLIELLNGAIRRPVELTTKLGITPFAALPLIRTRSESRRRTVAIVALLAAILLGLPLGLAAVHSYVMPLDELPTAAARWLRSLAG